MGRAFEFRKGRKLKRWGQMAKTFTRIGKDILIAIKSGGTDPSTNSRLRAVIQNAKSANMPMVNVENAIKKASAKDTEDYKEIVYEGYGAHGVAIVVECTTDNTNRTVANVRSYFNRCSGNLGTSGMLDFIFDKKCIFKLENNASVNVEELEFELIDFGADEVFLDEEENQINIYGDYTAFGMLQQFIKDNNLGLVSANYERLPNDFKKISPEQAEEVEKLLDKLDDDDDVQNVYHNMFIED